MYITFPSTSEDHIMMKSDHHALLSGLRRSTFNYLLLLLREDLEGRSNFERITISAEKQLYIGLYVLGTPDSYRSVVTKFDVSKATAWRAVKRVVKGLCKHRNYFIRWPNQREMNDCRQRLQMQYGFPGVIGALDGTHVCISAPAKEAQCYINRKRRHSLQLQVICNDKLKFLHCYAGLPGSVHDMRVFKYLGFQEKCSDEYFSNNTHIIADSAYILQKHVMIPYKDTGHLTDKEIRYNKLLSSTRMIVERSIGLLKGRWRCLLDKLPMPRTDLIPYYIISCVLHNICLLQDDEFKYPVIIDDNRNAEPRPMIVNQLLHNEGLMKRERIKNSFNI
ncbi:protein ANTAGONIST OF LIKE HETEROCHROMATIN PROTEIN 1 isoform X2 [Monomorium pharaonis]|uniref:protein ANTAGONIST OF LIKE HETEROCHROMATIN PROTEIN 1 isoform X2 n=1 Tax=Monomorium pharaonis TaxID=307658 RepID=UPI001745C8F1|nr:protein ANTAGONIST OF LIKE HETEROCHROMATIN PROTEIN 1 isoform X2 [Monomorium pharaonis]